MRRSPCSGRTVADGSSHLGPPTAPSSTASDGEQDVEVLVAHGRAVGVDGDAAGEDVGPVDGEPEALPGRVEDAQVARRRSPGRCRRPDAGDAVGGVDLAATARRRIGRGGSGVAAAWAVPVSGLPIPASCQRSFSSAREVRLERRLDDVRREPVAGHRLGRVLGIDRASRPDHAPGPGRPRRRRPPGSRSRPGSGNQPMTRLDGPIDGPEERVDGPVALRLGAHGLAVHAERDVAPRAAAVARAARSSPRGAPGHRPARPRRPRPTLRRDERDEVGVGDLLLGVGQRDGRR